MALENLKKFKKGGTIIIKRDDSLKNYISDPVELDALVSSELITNIFEGSKTPLHDGALIIEGRKIRYASTYINFLSADPTIPPSFGTRHRSGIGITEKTDAIAIILSEETGGIILANNGKFDVVPIGKIENELKEILK